MAQEKMKNKVNQRIPFPILVIIVVVACLLLWGVGARIASAIQTAGTPKAIQHAYNDNDGLGRFSSYRDTVTILLAAKILDAKIGETKTNVCYLETIDGGGWTIDGYTQRCYLRITVGYYTNYSKQQVVKALDKSPYSGISSSLIHASPKTCALSDDNTYATVRYVEVGSSPSSENGFDDLNFEECGRPSPIQGLSSVDTRTLGTNLSVKQLSSINTSAINNSRNQIWVEKDYDYFNQKLVCLPVLIPIMTSCDLSRNQPVQ